MNVVIAFGGSILAPADFDESHTRACLELLRDASKETKLVVVVGGGAPAREAIRRARPFVKNVHELDLIGIAGTRLNAERIRASLLAVGADVPTRVPTDRDQAKSLTKKHAIVVMGGTEPGHSTDQVAASMAVKLGWNLVVASNVSGIYTADPRSNPDAKLCARLTHQELAAIVGDLEWKDAGQAGIIDGPATKLILDNKLTLSVVDGRLPNEVRSAIFGAPFAGSIVQ